MGIKVLIFIDEIRPDENWLGLMQISENAEIVNEITVVGNFPNKHKDHLSPKVTLKKSVSIREVSSNQIVFGLPSKYIFQKIINILIRKSVFLGVVPGKITKAIGFYKHPGNSIKGKIGRLVRSLVPYNYCLAEDFEDAMYLATAFRQDIDSYLPIGLPKNIHIALEFLKDKEERKRGILFVPTHRWEGKSSIISQWLADQDLMNALKKFNIFYNNHPDEDDCVLDNSVVHTRKLKKSFWGSIDILVTDYSSIANDFLSADGKNVIHITSDLQEFEQHQGRSPLPYQKQFPGFRCNSKVEFLDVVEGINDFKKRSIDIAAFSNSWIEKILSLKH